MNQARATFAGYRLDQLLATDTVSTTYRATPLRQRASTGRAVALRITQPLRTSGQPDGALIAACIDAVTAALTIDHPALAPIVDVGDVDDRVYVATALGDGDPLGRYVGDHGRLHADDAVALLRDLADLLDRVHACRIVHGAISPRAIQIRSGDGGRPLAVLDGFGIATLLANRVRQDRDAVEVDDVAYVAPERVRGLDADARTDQYALACALYHCIAARPPFVRATVAEMFGAHLLGAVPRLPDGVDSAVLGALAVGLRKRPEERHASCADLVRATGRAPATESFAVAWPPGRAVGSARAAAATGAGRHGTHRRGVRLGGERWPVLAWPVATMLVLSGIVSTLALASLLNDGRLVASGGVGDDDGRLAAGSLAASGAAPAAGVRWQQRLTDEALYALEVTDGAVIAAAPHSVIALDRSRGTSRWRREIDVGVLTDMTTTGDVVALRASTFLGLSVADGSVQWDKADIVAPISALASADGVIYGLGPGRLTPEVVALDATSGEPLWRYDGGTHRIDDDASVAAIAGIVALLDGDGVSVIDPDDATSPGRGRAALQRVRWRTAVIDPWLHSLAVLPDAVVVATRAGYVCAYDPTDGEQRWCTPIAGLAERSPTVIADRDAIVILQGSTVTVLALETGARRWTFEAPRTLRPIAASTGRQVIVSDVSGGAYGLDLERGYEAWRASGFGEITALVATEDAIYAGTRDGVLVRVEPPVDGVPS